MPIPRPRSDFHCPGGYTQHHMRTIGDLIRTYYVIQRAVDDHLPHPLSPGDPSDAECELAYIQALIAEVPITWLQSAIAVVQHPAAQPPWPPTVIAAPCVDQPETEQCVESMLLSRLGWRGLPGGKSVAVAKLSVKSATSLQLGQVRAARRERHRQFVALALGTSSASEVAVAVKQLSAVLCRLWKRIKWDNLLKEVYWRFVINALPTAERMHQQDSACLCGTLSPGRQHHFWDCPVAQAVVECIAAELPADWCSRAPVGCPVHQRHVWLMMPPGGSKPLHKLAWMVVCLAAINGMDCGRKRANELRREWHIQQSVAANAGMVAAASQLPQTQSRITQFFHPVPLTPAQQQHRQSILQHRHDLLAQQRLASMHHMLLQAKQHAVARFWQLLADFVVLNPCSSPGFDTLSHDHPLLCLNHYNFLSLAPRNRTHSS